MHEMVRSENRRLSGVKQSIHASQGSHGYIDWGEAIPLVDVCFTGKVP